MKKRNHFDGWSLLVITITLILFLTALITTGFTHDLLLEAGVFLVSVKLIVMSHKNSIANESIHQKLDEVLSALLPTKRSHSPAIAFDPDPFRDDRPSTNARGE